MSYDNGKFNLLIKILEIQYYEPIIWLNAKLIHSQCKTISQFGYKTIFPYFDQLIFFTELPAHHTQTLL